MRMTASSKIFPEHCSTQTRLFQNSATSLKLLLAPGSRLLLQNNHSNS
jgi:hypothetical protein